MQPKEAEASALAAYCGGSRYASHGQRVIAGQLLMQAESDIFLGWTHVTGPDGVGPRLLRAPAQGLEVLLPDRADDPLGHGDLRANLRVDPGPAAPPLPGDRIALAAYLGGSDKFDQAIADFAEAYADQNDRDYAALQAAVKDGRAPDDHRHLKPHTARKEENNI